MYRNQKGFSVVEITSAVVIMGIIGTLSVKQYGTTRAKSRKLEAKTQLGLLHRGEQSWLLQNGTYTSQINLIMFPKGKIRYNVGFEININDFSYCQKKTFNAPSCPGASRNPNPNWCIYPSHSYKHINNTWELCGTTFKRSSLKKIECAFQDRLGKEINCSTCSQGYKDIWQKIKWTGTNINKINGNVNRCEDENRDTYKKFYAYAIGEIGSDSVSAYTWDKNKLDVWVIDQEGVLENCYDPLKETTWGTQCHKTP